MVYDQEIDCSRLSLSRGSLGQEAVSGNVLSLLHRSPATYFRSIHLFFSSYAISQFSRSRLSLLEAEKPVCLPV